MRNKKKIGSLLLAGIMMLSMGTYAFASDGIPTVGNENGVSITKDLVMAEGIKTPNYTFKFTVEKGTPDAPTATIEDIMFEETDEGIMEAGMKTVSKQSDITFEPFPHAGEYVYTVKETKESEDGVEYSTDTYKLRVYVVNDTNGLRIRNMTAENGTSNKVSEMKFTNTYRKDASLVISNVTSGEVADKTKNFKFTITITPSKTATDPSTYIGKIGDKTVNVTTGQPTEFTLRDGENLTFASLPAGTRYVVTEKGIDDGYTPSVRVVENGIVTVTKTGTDADDFSSTDKEPTNLVGEGENKVAFTNTYKDVPITGIFMNNLPFMFVIGIAVMALGSLVILKKQRNARR